MPALHACTIRARAAGVAFALAAFSLAGGCGGAGTPPVHPPGPAATLSGPAHPPPVSSSEMRAVEEELRAQLRTVPGTAAAAYVRDVPSGAVAAVHPDQRFLAASVIKLPVAGAALALWEKRPARRTPDALRDLELMITESDNPATDRLVEAVGGVEAVTRFCKERGWHSLVMGSKILPRPIRGANQITAREIGEFLAAVDARTLVSPTADEELWRLLCRQQKRRRIPAGVPDLPGITVGNKTGTIRRVLHDVAIIHTPRTRYVLCVLLADPRSEGEGEAFCRRVSWAVFHLLHPQLPEAATRAGE